MQLRAAFLLLASCVLPAAAIYADEVDHIDYHHALLGIPTPDSTFFLKPSSASNASLLYTLSENRILGAVNPRDGSVVWRQNLSRFAQDHTDNPDKTACLLRAADGTNTVVSAAGGYISSWSALDGKLGWESWFGDSVADLELLELPGASAGDVIALFGGKNGVVRSLDSESGRVKWEFKDDRFGFLVPFWERVDC